MKKFILFLIALLTAVGAWANVKFITDVKVIGGTESEVNTLKENLTTDGWTFIDQNLNAGCSSSSDYIYLLYKSDYVNSGYITDFYISNKSGTAADYVDYDGRRFYLAAFEGGSRFAEIKGDLNSHAGGDYIHLYYTRAPFDDNRAVTDITFNNVKEGAVGKNGDTTGYDLNAGAGGDYIYMHFGTARQGWTAKEWNNNKCFLNGYNGNWKEITTLNIPTTYDGMTVVGFLDTIDFSSFENLETMNFYEGSSIDEMPVLEGCKKFKQVNVLTASGVEENHLPASIKYIPPRTFAGTAINTLYLPEVVEVWEGSVGVFEGCNNLELVQFSKAAFIGRNAFANIYGGICAVDYYGPLENWDYRKFHHSPNVVVVADDGYCGWCGDTTANNSLYWTLKNKTLAIDCGDPLKYNNYKDAQVISTHNWSDLASDIDSIDVNRVYAIRNNEFKALTYLTSVHLNTTLDSIGPRIFNGCSLLKDIWFDGTQQQWSDVRKDGLWRKGAPEELVEHWRCTVTFNANGHGTAPNSQTNLWSNYDRVRDVAEPTATGYHFLGWYTDSTFTNRWDFVNKVPGDMTLYAKWESTLKRGDLNGDEMVDVTDVSLLIDVVLGKEVNLAVGAEPDLNNDTNMDVTDVSLLIDIVLGK